MAGHSKWKNIMHRKGAQDAKRAKQFQKLSRQIYVAAKQGDKDPDTNPNLRLAIDKARAFDMPKDNIERAVKKAAGDLDGQDFFEIVYEGYAPNGVAVMVNCLSDNRNRTAANVRAAFNKHDGNMGENGSVSYLFDRKGLLIISREMHDFSEEEIMMSALEGGAEDIEVNEDSFEVTTESEAFDSVKKALTNLGATFTTSEITMVPQTYIKLEREDAEKVLDLIDVLEDDDDAQVVYHNLDSASLD
ncbi:YebC/PmpR family DNA-binding transcriptional regulator [Haloplasma contractile]|uniref:Probable transcriptional regulatory protein HLPCO_001098 n=1 Tax=Haloplasma contractile SSD-17B TaxID=1033810 RepID=F7PX04_9MOLU|nr:YebC/PmpR family DNA-binding transcriptional regulator [Haloplasma contractile]ERJ12758.1 putative transcriptional regulatory protein YrbC [Haloplasma contractile SSD-17B]